jgi:carboxylesterase
VLPFPHNDEVDVNNKQESLPHGDCQKCKQKTGVLLFHGLTGMPSELKPLAKILTQEGYHVETPLIAGHGGTHQALLKTTWKDWLESAEEAFARMQHVCNEIYVGGLSMGAVLAATLAARHPEVKGLLLLSPHLGINQENLQASQCLLPVGYYLKPLHGLFYWSEKAPYGLKDTRLQRKIEQAIQNSKAGQTSHYGLYRTYIGSIYQMQDLITYCKKYVHQVTCPTLILQSLEDTITKLENASLIYALLGSRVKQVRMFSGCNHVMSVDLRKKDVGAWITQFIQEQALSSAPTNAAFNCLPVLDFDQLHVDITAEGPSRHAITVRMGEHPVLIWPVQETRLRCLQSLSSGKLFGWLKKTRAYAVGFSEAEQGSSIYVHSDAPAAVLKDAWQRAWLALDSLRKAQKVASVVFMPHANTELLRTFYLQNGFAQVPISNARVDEAETSATLAVWHTNPFIQSFLLSLSLVAMEKKQSPAQAAVHA